MEDLREFDSGQFSNSFEFDDEGAVAKEVGAVESAQGFTFIVNWDLVFVDKQDVLASEL